MAGNVFGKIANALAGTSTPQAGNGTLNQVGYDTRSMEALRAGRGKPNAEAAAQLGGHTTSGLDAAMAAHADKLHPVK